MAVKTFNVGRAISEAKNRTLTGKALKAAIKTAEDFGFEKEAQELKMYLASASPARRLASS
jgi:hypothetical protein